MSVAELQKSIADLPTGPRRSVAKYVAYLKRRDAPVRRRLLADIGREMDAGKSFSMAQVEEARMRSVLGCARKFRPGKNSQRILIELRGYDRGEL